MIPKSLAEQGKVQFLPKQPFTFTPVVACGQLYALLDARRLGQRFFNGSRCWRHRSSAPQVDEFQACQARDFEDVMNSMLSCFFD